MTQKHSLEMNSYTHRHGGVLFAVIFYLCPMFFSSVLFLYNDFFIPRSKDKVKKYGFSLFRTLTLNCIMNESPQSAM